MNTICKRPSPCLRCTRVSDPRACENKGCRVWQQWFLERWALIHAYPRRAYEATALEPAGVVVGGHHYESPHRVRAYLQADPCQSCLCPKDLCTQACHIKRTWLEAKGEAFL